ncbi:hypothetical protein QE375_003613 [Microbacterium foliorum]|uniref:Glycosyl hydrolases family 43 n=1 Tax=Microbacterium foliorum TaxID=104336 RepID=A0ABU1HXN5_9MICO|nr:hypothetical protein [Microbacterium foliorum]
MASSAEAAGYLYVHFKRESEDGEQIQLALSNGNDPLHFDDLNGGRPVLRSVVGERGVRDPYLVQSPVDGRYFMVATDLRLHGSPDWDRSLRRGSRSIVVWESTDLVDWGEGRLVQVASTEGGNAWAPEGVWDPEQDAFLVYWSSMLYDNERHQGESYNRIMCATTRDFREFSQPRVWIDRGWPTIDATVIRHDGRYYRFLKDERARGGGAPQASQSSPSTPTRSLPPHGILSPKASASTPSARARARWSTNQTWRRSDSCGLRSSHRSGGTSPSRRRISPAARGLRRRTSVCLSILVTGSCYPSPQSNTTNSLRPGTPDTHIDGRGLTVSNRRRLPPTPSSSKPSTVTLVLKPLTRL